MSELLQGGTLRDALAGGALPPRKAIELAIQIASGLAAAHEAGIVHRDLEPETSLAREVVAPFEGKGLDTFVERYRAVSRAVPALRLVFSDLDANRRAVAEVRLLNLDTGALGDHYREDTIVVEPDADHLDLLDSDRPTRHIDALVTGR